MRFMTCLMLPVLLSSATACGGNGGGHDTETDADVAPDTPPDGDAQPDADAPPDGIDVPPDTVDVPDGAELPDISGIIPPDRRVAWDPGVRGGIPPESEVCPASSPSVTDFGAAGNGTTDDAAAFQAAVDAAAEGSAVRVPEGTYLIGTTVTIDRGVVLCGEGPALSRLHLETDGVGLSIVTYDRGDFVAVSSGATKDSTRIEVADASSFTPGRYAELQQTNDWSVMDPESVWRSSSWVPEDCVGQMFRVTAVEGSTLVVEPPVHFDYVAAQNPVIRSMGLVDGAGLQGLYMTRLGTSDSGTVEIKNAVNSWVRACESDTTMVAHVGVSSALWCEIRDSYFHDSYSYGGGGHGYGASLGNHVTDSLIENNIFVHLRHSMIIQVGASGNVYGYNYSINPYQDEGGDWTPCDISLHGHYLLMNLFEGNTVQEIDVSDYWGASGPGNTMFRNRVEAEGIEVMDYSHRQNVVGNELGTDPNVVGVDGTVTDTLIHGNYENGAVSWDPAIEEHELPASLYLESKPAFFGGTPWPVTGADLAPSTGKIPAQERYEGM